MQVTGTIKEGYRSCESGDVSRKEGSVPGMYVNSVCGKGAGDSECEQECEGMVGRACDCSAESAAVQLSVRPLGQQCSYIYF